MYRNKRLINKILKQSRDYFQFLSWYLPIYLYGKFCQLYVLCWAGNLPWVHQRFLEKRRRRSANKNSDESVWAVCMSNTFHGYIFNQFVEIRSMQHVNPAEMQNYWSNWLQCKRHWHCHRLVELWPSRLTDAHARFIYETRPGLLAYINIH